MYIPEAAHSGVGYHDAAVNPLRSARLAKALWAAKWIVLTLTLTITMGDPKLEGEHSQVPADHIPSTEDATSHGIHLEARYQLITYRVLKMQPVTASIWKPVTS